MPELVADSFVRSNSSSSLGSADIGGAWTAQAGTGGISSNAAYFPSVTTLSSGDPLGMATINHGWADGYAQITVPSSPPTLAGGQGLGVCVRYSSNTNFIFAFVYGDAGDSNHNLYLRKTVSGANTDLISASANSVTYPAVLKVIFQGSSLSVFINGTQMGSTQTDSFNSTATQHGLVSYNSTGQVIKTYIAESYTRQNRVLG